ncbi:MAG TPA: c-type cytochrome [Vicinamibacterales bacterium]|nr:c-type cytochrome [Vicinamibacterales bacterium]
MTRVAWIVVVLAATAFGSSCEREARRYQELPAAANRETGVRLTTLQPGAPQQHETVQSPYQNNAWGMSEGKRLYAAYNCTGCHGANGGGAIGPALKDDKWIYGSQPDQIYSTISQGRPDGMPSFGGHIPAQQIWMLVAYVQSMSGVAPKDAAPSRNDAQMSAVPESRAGYTPPVQTGHR